MFRARLLAQTLSPRFGATDLIDVYGDPAIYVASCCLMATTDTRSTRHGRTPWSAVDAVNPDTTLSAPCCASGTRPAFHERRERLPRRRPGCPASNDVRLRWLTPLEDLQLRAAVDRRDHPSRISGLLSTGCLDICDLRHDHIALTSVPATKPPASTSDVPSPHLVRWPRGPLQLSRP